MKINRYQWTVPVLKSVPHILDSDRFQVIVHSQIFAIECIHNVFLRIRHGLKFQYPGFISFQTQLFNFTFLQ